MYGLKVNECRFTSLRALGVHYNKHTLAEFNRRLKTYLYYPVRKPPLIMKVDIYEALCVLADKGRKLSTSRKQYVVLLDQEKEANNSLRLTYLKAKAYQNARIMVESLLICSEVTQDEAEERQKLNSQSKTILQANTAQALRLHRVLLDRSEALAQPTVFWEEELNRITRALNCHVTKLMDIEENCAQNQKQLLDCGAKPEMLECLLNDDNSLEHSWNRSLWFVNCSRDEAVSRLADKEIGTFLIRPKEESETPYALSIVCNNEDGQPDVKHCVIYHPEGRGYGFRREGSVFNNIDELVYRHAHTSIKVYFSHMDTCLAYPVFIARSRVNSCEENL